MKSRVMTGGVGVRKGADKNDFFRTPRVALESLIANVSHAAIYDDSWIDPCCGDGVISEFIKEKALGQSIESYDLVARGYGESGVDFFLDKQCRRASAIINPPFSYAKEFIAHALEIIQGKVYVFVPVRYMATKWFYELPRPQKIIIMPTKLDISGGGKGMYEFMWVCWDGIGARLEHDTKIVWANMWNNA